MDKKMKSSKGVDEKLSRELDQELENTFPASDPTSSSQPGHDRDRRVKQDLELDQELEDTFPASDPPSLSQPGGDTVQSARERSRVSTDSGSAQKPKGAPENREKQGERPEVVSPAE